MRRKKHFFKGFALLFLLSLVAFCEAAGLPKSGIDINEADPLILAKRFAEAEQLCQDFLETRSDDPESVYQGLRRLPAIYLGMNNQAKTQAAIQQLLTRSAKHQRLPHAIHEFINQAKGLNKTIEAEEICEVLLAEKLDQTQAIWLRMGAAIASVHLQNDQNVETILQGIMTQHGSDERVTEALGQVAWAYRQLEDYGKARTVYKYVVEKCPKTARTVFSQRGIVLCSIAIEDEAATEVALQKLLDDFSDSPDLPEMVRYIAASYYRKGNLDQARLLHQYNVDHYNKELPGMYSQVEIVKMLLDFGVRDTAGRQAEADAAVNTLATTFAHQPGLAKELYGIARLYQNLKQADRAAEVDQYNAQQFPADLYGVCSAVCADLEAQVEGEMGQTLDRLKPFKEHKDLTKTLYTLGRDFLKQGKSAKAMAVLGYNSTNPGKEKGKYALLSQTEIARCHIRSANLPEAETSVQKLVQDFGDQSTLPREICRVADTFLSEGQVNQAKQLYEQVANRWPESDHLLWARVGSAKMDILNGSFGPIDQRLDTLLSEYPDHPDIAKAIFQIGEQYWDMAQASSSKSGSREKGKDTKAFYGQALLVWENMIQSRPRSNMTAQGYHFMGECHYSLGQTQEALKCYQMICDEWPDYRYAADLHLRMAKCYKYELANETTNLADGLARINETLKRMDQNAPETSTLKISNKYLKINKPDLDGNKPTVGAKRAEGGVR